MLFAEAAALLLRFDIDDAEDDEDVEVAFRFVSFGLGGMLLFVLDIEEDFFGFIGISIRSIPLRKKILF